MVRRLTTRGVFPTRRSHFAELDEPIVRGARRGRRGGGQRGGGAGGSAGGWEAGGVGVVRGLAGRGGGRAGIDQARGGEGRVLTTRTLTGPSQSDTDRLTGRSLLRLIEEHGYMNLTERLRWVVGIR